MKSFFTFVMISFLCSMNCVYASDSGPTISDNQPTIAELPDEAFAQLPDGSYMVMVSDATLFRPEPLKYYEVLALHTGREKHKRRGGGYHWPIQHWQVEYATHVARNPRINPDEDMQAQAVLLRLKSAVLFCNAMYPKVRQPLS